MDYAKLEKEVKVLEQRKFLLNNEITNLSNEKVKYLEEIPKAKQWAEDQRALAQSTADKTTETVKQYNLKTQELKDLNGQINDAKNQLDSLKAEHDAELIRLQPIQEDIKNKTSDLKSREIVVRDRISLADSKEAINKQNSETLAQKVVDLGKKQAEFDKKNAGLIEDIGILQAKQQKHLEATALFESNKVIYFNQQQELNAKILKAEGLVKENEDLKKDLLDKSMRLTTATNLAEKKREALERNIADLDNQRKSLQIMELKLKKMAHDAGLDKELAELKKSF